MDEYLVNSELMPSEVNNARWLYCLDSDWHDQELSAYANPDLSGKWMMFFKKGEEMDRKWKEASDLYHQRKLIGISSMKASTAYQNPERRTNDVNGVICFYCGPAYDENTLMKYGRNILAHISYDAVFMRYKNDKQTTATGQRINSLYKIQVSSVNCRASVNLSDSQNSISREGQAQAPRRMSSDLIESLQEEREHLFTASFPQIWRQRDLSPESNWRSCDRTPGVTTFFVEQPVRRSNWREREVSETNWREREVSETNWRTSNRNTESSSSTSDQNSQNNVQSGDNTALSWRNTKRSS